MSYIPSIWIWLGIIACITLSALFAGLNLAAALPSRCMYCVPSVVVTRGGKAHT